MDKSVKDNKFEELTINMEKMLKEQLVANCAKEYSKSQEIIMKKVSNENTAITYSIGLINKKVIDNIEKYSDVENELNNLMGQYKNNLEELANYHDSQIVLSYTKLYEEELRKIKLQREIYQLIQKEKKAKAKVDNSDDEIREEICDLEDKLSNVEGKIKRIKPIIKKKIEDKENGLNKAIESENTELQKSTIKGPRIFEKAKKFFLGKIKPYKLIEKNVFTNLKQRLETFSQSEEQPKKINESYLEKQILSTIDLITVEE